MHKPFGLYVRALVRLSMLFISKIAACMVLFILLMSLHLLMSSFATAHHFIHSLAHSSSYSYVCRWFRWYQTRTIGRVSHTHRASTLSVIPCFGCTWLLNGSAQRFQFELNRRRCESVCRIFFSKFVRSSCRKLVSSEQSVFGLHTRYLLHTISFYSIYRVLHFKTRQKKNNNQFHWQHKNISIENCLRFFSFIFRMQLNCSPCICECVEFFFFIRKTKNRQKELNNEKSSVKRVRKPEKKKLRTQRTRKEYSRYKQLIV